MLMNVNLCQSLDVQGILILASTTMHLVTRVMDGYLDCKLIVVRPADSSIKTSERDHLSTLCTRI